MTPLDVSRDVVLLGGSEGRDFLIAGGATVVVVVVVVLAFVVEFKLATKIEG